MTVSAHTDMPTSTDGYVRVPVARLAALTLNPIWAAADEEVLLQAWEAGMPACRAGYCEWVDQAWLPPITLGWCWFVDPLHTYRLLPQSVSGNVMIVGPKGYDVGPARTTQCLEDWICTLPWSECIDALAAHTDL